MVPWPRGLGLLNARRAPAGRALRLACRCRPTNSRFGPSSTRASSVSYKARPAHGSSRSCWQVSPPCVAPAAVSHQRARSSSQSFVPADGRVDQLRLRTFATKLDRWSGTTADLLLPDGGGLNDGAAMPLPRRAGCSTERPFRLPDQPRHWGIRCSSCDSRGGSDGPPEKRNQERIIPSA